MISVLLLLLGSAGLVFAGAILIALLSPLDDSDDLDPDQVDPYE